MATAIMTALVPHNNVRKSFYNKAMVERTGNTVTLYSYGTPVLRITPSFVIRLWNDYSATTQRHIDSFCMTYLGRGMGKREYEDMSVGRRYPR